MVTQEIIKKELEKVIDPEIGIPITQMELIDDILIKDNEVTVKFHLTMPYCPAVFATQIAQDIRKVVSKLKDVKRVRVELQNHYMAEQINKEVNR